MERNAADSKGFIEDFINSRVKGHGLDRRTEKAYRLDLEHFFAWAEQRQRENTVSGEK